MVTIKLMHKIEGRGFRRPFSWLSIPDRMGKTTYRVPYISARSMLKSETVERLLREVGEGKNPPTSNAEIRSCCDWFCTLFNNQFTVDELLDGHPADHLMSDIFGAYMAVQSGVAEALKKFPMPPTAKRKKK